MSNFIPWDSQPLDEWASKYAPGEFIDLDGRKTHYIEMGSGEPVILVHGFNYDSYSWVNNMEALASEHKVYALDLWGSGFSTREPLDYGYELFAHQLLLFMDALEISKASLVGHSMGGGTVIYFTLHHAGRVEKLILVNSVGIRNPLPLRGKLFQLPYIPEFLLGLKTNAIRQKNLKDNWIYNKRLLTDSYFEEATRFQKIKGSTKIQLSILRKEFFNTLDEEIKQLGQKMIPTIIIWGKEDSSIPIRIGEEMHRLMPGSRLEIIDNAGHLSNFDQSIVFDKLVADFLSADQPNPSLNPKETHDRSSLQAASNQ
ncbi:MAG: alpha/beta hydrolase [Anaerolineae bacterium]|nr:MAG: alpha/beta hydrolase [Anaerolineae bacterium]